MIERSRVRPLGVALGIVLVLLGFLAIFSVGFPILLAGLFVLLAATTGAHRRHPQVYWPLVAATSLFFVGYVLVAPLTCTSRATVVDGVEEVGGTSCTNVVGIEYGGGQDYAPPLWPAAIVGITAGALAGALTRRLISDPRQDPDGSGP